VEIDLSGTVTLRMHRRCDNIWQAEIDKRGETI
jgi:hypothetical protein